MNIVFFFLNLIEINLEYDRYIYIRMVDLNSNSQIKYAGFVKIKKLSYRKIKNMY